MQAAWTAVNVAGNDAACPTGNDFSLAASPPRGAVNPGSSVTTTVPTDADQRFGADDGADRVGPAGGRDGVVRPASISSAGGTSTLTISTTAATPTGTYAVTITGTGGVGDPHHHVHA